MSQGWETLGDYLFSELKSDFEKMGDGRYNLIFGPIVIDEHGAIAYYDYQGIQLVDVKIERIEQSFVAKQLDEKVRVLISSAPAFKPATIMGKPVPCAIFGIFGAGMDNDKSGATILVKDHRATIHLKKK